MSIDVLQRYTWHGEPKELGQLWRLRKTKDAALLEAVCSLWSHQFGWEVRLDVLSTGERWKAAMGEKGWS